MLTEHRTAVEEIMSHSLGRPVRSGDVAWFPIAMMLATDGSAPAALRTATAVHRRRLSLGDGVVLCCDHYDPRSTQSASATHAQMREFATLHGAAFYEFGSGIGHQLAVERGHVRPGMLTLAADSHAPTYGALGAVAFGVGATDLGLAIATGELWLTVPGTIRVRLRGRLPRSTMAKDLVLDLIRRLGPAGAADCALEFVGDGVASLGIDERLTIANMAVESGAATAIFPVDSATDAYLSGIGIHRDTYRDFGFDERASVCEELTVDCSTIEPLVSGAHELAVITPLASGRQPVDVVYIGTCTGGRASDIVAVVEVLRAAGGKADGVQLIVAPASRSIAEELSAAGIVDELRRLGATILAAGCGSCCGTAGPIPGDGTVVVSTANRNFKGRMGNPRATIHLASPRTCARAAVDGWIQA